MVNYTKLAQDLGAAWRETHPDASEDERLNAAGILVSLVGPPHITLFFKCLVQAMETLATEDPPELEHYKEGVRYLHSALGEIEVYRRNALAGFAANDGAEVIKWLTVMEQEWTQAKEVISRLLILKSGPLQGPLGN